MNTNRNKGDLTTRDIEIDLKVIKFEEGKREDDEEVEQYDSQDVLRAIAELYDFIKEQGVFEVNSFDLD